MRPQSLVIALVTLLTLPSHAKLEAHEWGTFTSLVGSNGITQDGMIHEDEVLPNFVHEFGELRQEVPPPPPFEPRPRPCRSKICFGNDFFENNAVTQKMETPVIYFYADRAQKVSVNVRFPEGVITQTFPGPVRTSPTRTDIQRLVNGNTTFDVEVLNSKQGVFPAVDASNIYNHARLVASNAIRSGAEEEKFIFYRGIGRFQPKMSIQSKSGRLVIEADPGQIPQAAFLVHVNEKGEGQILPMKLLPSQGRQAVEPAILEAMKNHQGPSIVGAVRGEQARGMLVDALMNSGLFRDEAFAMINTWEHGYLKVPGLRLLYVLPSSEVEEILPLTMTPAPDKLVRSFVGRIEILLDTEEQLILGEILKQGESFRVESLGRFAEPILRRVREVSAQMPLFDPVHTALLKQLVERAKKAEFVSNLE